MSDTPTVPAEAAGAPQKEIEKYFAAAVKLNASDIHLKIGEPVLFRVKGSINRTKQPLRSAIEYIAMMPVAIPGLIIGMGFLWAWIVLPLPIYGTLTILVLAYTARFMPQGYRAISASIAAVLAPGFSARVALRAWM